MADTGIEPKDSGQKGSKKVRVKKQSTNVDMTPLADLGFLLITFFMFTTTFSKPNVMGLNMPPKTPPDDKQIDRPEIDISNSISIILGGDNKIYWHQQEQQDLNPETLVETDYSKDGIRKEILIARKKAKDEEKFTVIIKPTDDSNYENLVNVLDEMEITQSTRYGIVDPSPNELSVYEQKTGKSSGGSANNE
ncbi:MAG: biopolymer transporter ExbD [Flavobacteriia bacterium]|nr:biopolymer transporter ExbD [Flavobacteriia bacterium]